MGIFQNIVITDIDKPAMVFSEKGRDLYMKERPCFGLSYCCSGQITYTQNGVSYISTPENVILLPKGGCYRICGDETGIFPVLDFQCSGLDCNTIQVFPLKQPEKHLNNVQTLSDLFVFKDKKLKIYSLFYEILEQIQTEQACSDNPLYPIIDYLEQHIGDPSLSNAALAEKLGISEVYFRKLFSLHYGTTPKQYILDIRIKKAQQLLAHDTCSVTQIAEICGFTSVYHFCRIFKTKTGMTPLDYAKKHRIYHI